MTKPKNFIGNVHDCFVAYRLDNDTAQTLHNELDYLRFLRNLHNNNGIWKHDYINTKRIQYSTGVIRWLKTFNPKAFFVCTAVTKWGHNDSIEVFYQS